MEESTNNTTMIGLGDINQLPEDCISHVIALTPTARDACVSSAVSRSSFLSHAVDPVQYGSKKELYFRLCDHPVLIYGGSMSFGLDKLSGAKCFMISARALSIVWGDDSSCWNWIARPDSRFSECAELYAVCWLEICGKIDSKILTLDTSYIASLIYKLANHTGLNYPFQEAKITLAGVTISEHPVSLYHRERVQFNSWWDRHLPGEEATEEIDDVCFPRGRQDGWLEVDLGEFYSGDGTDGEVDMSFMEIKGGHWKRGLIVLGIEVRPKH